MSGSIKSFGSDNHSGMHPSMLEAMASINSDHAPSYGTDPLTKEASKLFKKEFGQSAQTFFVFNGTAANVLCLSALVESYNSVICCENSHLNLDECGAPEKHIGCKLIPLPSENGKITAQQIKECLIRMGDQHFSQPKAVSITQPTELGTVYSLDEMREIRAITRKHGLYLHVDGARLIHAANYLNCSLKDLTEGMEIDALSFGGTKNGLLFGEAVVLFDKERAKNFKFLRKQLLQLPSKMRFLSAQFIQLLESKDGRPPLWQEIAKNSHVLAQKLAQLVADIPEIKITQAVQANSVFAIVPKEWLKPLREKFFFYVWDEKTWEVRWMLSFDMTSMDVDEFVTHIHKVRNDFPLNSMETRNEI